MTSPRPEHVKVTYRRMQFDFEATGFEKYWHDGSPFISFFWDAMSTAFPPGEKFFIDSARSLRAFTDDLNLRAEISGFCRQEGHHTAQHIKFNRTVAAQGFDVSRLEARFANLLDRVRLRSEPLDMLAISMALEHFTAGFAEQYLQNPHVTRGADPHVVALWAWHAAEEAEHKATCYDLYRALGGGYFRRVSVMPVAWLLLVSITLRNTFDLLGQDGRRTNPRDLARGFDYLLGRHGLITRMLPAFFAYFRPSYHPWQVDDSELIAGWQRQNAQYIVSTSRDATSDPPGDRAGTMPAVA
jgi:uncharacterized protein